MAHVAPRLLTAVLLHSYRYLCHSPRSNGRSLRILAGYRWAGLIPYARQFTRHIDLHFLHENAPRPLFHPEAIPDARLGQ